MKLIYILLVLAIILILYTILDNDPIEIKEIEAFEESQMQSLFNCRKYPDLCYKKQYQNNKYRPYLSARKEYQSTLARMRAQNRGTY